MKKLPLLILPALALAACSEEAVKVEEKPRPVFSINVETAQIEAKQFIGKIEAHANNSLAFPLAGEVAGKFVNVSDVVKKGDLLAKLDPEDLKLQLATAEANLETLKAQFDASDRAVKRIENLFKEGFATEKNLEDVKRQNASLQSFMDQTNAQINRAKNLVSLTELFAPQDGVITQVNTEVGSFVGAGAPIIVLASTDNREVVFNLPIQESDLIDQNTQFEVSLTANEAIKVKAALKKIEPVANQQTRSRKIRLKLLNPPQMMRLGALVNVRILSEDQAFFKLPKSALLTEDNQNFVWVINRSNNQVSKKKIDLSYEDQNVIHVNAGLTAQDEILIKGVNSVKEGQMVGEQVSK